MSSTKGANKDDIYKLMEPGIIGALINANGEYLQIKNLHRNYNEWPWCNVQCFLNRLAIVCSGPIYKAHKKLIQPMLNGSSVMERFTKLFNSKSQALVERLEEKAGAGEFDAVDYVQFCIGDITFG